MRSLVGPNYESVFINFKKASRGSIYHYAFTKSRYMDVFKTIEWVIMRSDPLLEVDYSITRGITNRSHVSSQSLRKYILSIIPFDIEKGRNELPELFEVMFYGLTDVQIHFVAHFPTYLKNGVFKETIMYCSQPLDEEELEV